MLAFVAGMLAPGVVGSSPPAPDPDPFALIGADADLVRDAVYRTRSEATLTCAMAAGIEPGRVPTIFLDPPTGNSGSYVDRLLVSVLAGGPAVLGSAVLALTPEEQQVVGGCANAALDAFPDPTETAGLLLMDVSSDVRAIVEADPLYRAALGDMDECINAVGYPSRDGLGADATLTYDADEAVREYYAGALSRDQVVDTLEGLQPIYAALEECKLPFFEVQRESWIAATQEVLARNPGLVTAIRAQVQEEIDLYFA